MSIFNVTWSDVIMLIAQILNKYMNELIISLY